MYRKFIAVASAGAAIVIASPALAGPGGHGGGQAGGRAAASAQGGIGATTRDGARINSQGSVNANARAMERANSGSSVSSTTDTRIQTNTDVPNSKSQATTHSEGPEYASPNGIAHASDRSVLARSQVAASALPGLTTGLTVNDSTGASIGTVSQVVTGPSGSIRLVIVTDASGNQIRLAPNMLSISGGVVTTTQTDLGD